jgi:hypothetical protein
MAPPAEHPVTAVDTVMAHPVTTTQPDTIGMPNCPNIMDRH